MVSDNSMFGKVVCVCASAALAASMLVALPPAPSAHAASASEGDISNGVVNSDSDLLKLAEVVNGGDTLEGKTITLAGNRSLSEVSNFTPIGTKAHPFKGTFDGAGHTLSNLKITASGNAASYVGLFGYVGEGATIKNLTLTDSCSVTVTGTNSLVKCVGSLAGYVHGAIGGNASAIENCTSSAKVQVTSTMPGSNSAVTAVAPNADVDAGKTDEHLTIEYVGGLVGFCAGSMADDTFSGTLNVSTSADPDGENTVIARSVGCVAGQVGGYVLKEEISETEVAMKPQYPTAAGDFSTDGAVVAVRGCKNSGLLETKVDGDAGKDRFGELVSARLVSVGGIVGYAMANFSECVNEGEIASPSGDGTGGIVGCLRGVVFTGQSLAGSDAGTYLGKGGKETDRMKGPNLTVERCTNDASITGLHAAGGILGSGGTYTTVQTSANLDDAGRRLVLGVRWNKPTSGGIAGQTYGNVRYCYNRADVRTATGGGFYMAGVVGATARYTADRGDSVTSPVPDVCGCYSTGDVIASGSFKQAGVVGENDGLVRNCFFLKDSVSTGSAVATDNGTVAESVEALDSSADLKTKVFAAKLNGSATYSDYVAGCHFVPVASAAANNGYPVVAWQRPAAGTRLIDDGVHLSSSTVGKAVYSPTENPLPTVQALYDTGASAVELVQGADFYPVPDPDAAKSDGTCRDVVDIGTTVFHAAIVGMGDYSTGGDSTSLFKADYTVGQAQFSTCSVYIAPKTFDYVKKYPATPTDAADSDVIISDAAGNQVPVKEFDMQDETAQNEKYNEGKPLVGYGISVIERSNGSKEIVGGYAIDFTAKATSNYTGTITGYFKIFKAIVMGDKTEFGGLRYNGETWQWNMGNVTSGGSSEGYTYRMVDGKEVKGMEIPYNGESICPEIVSMGYKGGDNVVHEMKQGRAESDDYRVVYGDPGNPNLLISEAPDNPNTNVSSSKQGERACVTIRYASTSKECNFQNYQNIFFDIVQADVAKDCTVKLMATGVNKVAAVVRGKGPNKAVIPSSNYTVSTKAIAGDRVQVTVTGKNNLKGTYTAVYPGDGDTSLAGASVSGVPESYVYSGKANMPVPTVVLKGAALEKDKDYKLSYENNVQVGQGKVVIIGTGDYAWALERTFTIVPKATAVKKLTKGKKSFTVSWVKQAVQTSGYQVRYSTKKSMTGGKTKTVGKTGTLKLTVKKLKKKKKYYVQVRTFKKVGGVSYCSAWSKVKTVKTK